MTALADEELLRRLPSLGIDHDTKAFSAGWLEQRLMLNRCSDCGHWHHPPRPVCPECWSTSVLPTEVSGRGVVHLLIRVRQGPEIDGVDYLDGWPVATVELTEQPGLRYTSTVVDVDPSILTIGLPVELTWIERFGEPYPAFRPERAS